MVNGLPAIILKKAKPVKKAGTAGNYLIKNCNHTVLKLLTRDITNNVLPTIAYVYMWANQIGIPVKDFVLEKLQVKAHGIHYAMENALLEIEQKINKNIAPITPEVFAKNKQYVLMVIERV